MADTNDNIEFTTEDILKYGEGTPDATKGVATEDTNESTNTSGTPIVSQTDISKAEDGVSLTSMPGLSDGSKSKGQEHWENYMASRPQVKKGTAYEDLFKALNENPRGNTPEQQRKRERRKKAEIAIAGLGDLGAALANYWGVAKGGANTPLPQGDKSAVGKYKKYYDQWKENIDKYNTGLNAARQLDTKNYYNDLKEQRLNDVNEMKVVKTITDAEYKKAKNVLDQQKIELTAEKNKALTSKYASDAKKQEAISKYYDALIELNKVKQDYYNALADAATLNAQSNAMNAESNRKKADAAVEAAQQKVKESEAKCDLMAAQAGVMKKNAETNASRARSYDYSVHHNNGGNSILGQLLSGGDDSTPTPNKQTNTGVHVTLKHRK